MRSLSSILPAWGGVSLEKLLHHSLLTSAYARRIGEAQGANEQMVCEMFTAGMLHDLGILVLATSLPDRYPEVAALVETRHLALDEAERELLGCAHPEAGAYLLGLWGLSNPMVEAVAYHHRPMDCVNREFNSLAAVHVAAAFADQPRARIDGSGGDSVNLEYLDALGLADRLPVRRELCSSTVTDSTPHCRSGHEGVGTRWWR